MVEPEEFAADEDVAAGFACANAESGENSALAAKRTLANAYTAFARADSRKVQTGLPLDDLKGKTVYAPILPFILRFHCSCR